MSSGDGRLKTVRCALCAKRFFFAVPDTTTQQGKGCSSFVILRSGHQLLLSCFGSEFDENLFRVYTHLTVGPDDPICDLCIRGMLETGALAVIPGKFQVVPTSYCPPMPPREALN